MVSRVDGRRRALLMALAGAVVALALGVSQGTAPASEIEGEPGGPPACSALVVPSQPWGIDVWVQCNYEVSEISARSGNRKLRRLAGTPELLGARPTDAMACRLRSGTLSCHGRAEPLARVHVRLNVDEAACNRPRMRLSVLTTGGPRCEPGANCAGVEFSNWTPAALGSGRGACGGH